MPEASATLSARRRRSRALKSHGSWPAKLRCARQEAQTCIHNCNELCPSTNVVPSEDCKAVPSKV